jgi:serine/threonine-protein kinase
MSEAFGLLKPGDVVGEFEVIEPLAEGGMGAVFVARQKSTGRRRALKVLHPRVVLDAKLRERFLAEATVSAEIGGPHPVDVVACGIDAQRNIPWIAMELLEGETLESRVRRAPLAPSECAALFRELGDVLERAHRKGIIHRDLKPENVFLVRVSTSERGFVSKVLDFGIAAFLSEGRTAATATRAMGTPLWMAPEQYEARGKIRPSTDVWSLGLIAFFALTGREFWLSAHADGASVAALIAEIIANPIPLASERLRELHAEPAANGALIPATRAHPSPLPEGFDAWFARCVARDPRARFETGAEACAALVSLLAADLAQSGARAAIEKTVPAAPVVRESREEPPGKTIPALPHPDALAHHAQEPSSQSAKSRPAPESNAPLFGAVGFIIVGALSVLAWKALNPPAPSPAAASAAPTTTSSAIAGASLAGGASTQLERVRVAHVLVAHAQSRGGQSVAPRSVLEARLAAERLRRRALNGEDFAMLARMNSDDRRVRETSGDLGFITRGQTVPAFERAAFALSVGQISEVVSTDFGFHVIKRLE